MTKLSLFAIYSYAFQALFPKPIPERDYLSQVIAAVAVLTHEPGVPYMDYVRCIGSNVLARKVKMADLKDNMNLSRISAPTAKDYARIEKYQTALALLESAP